MHAGSEHEAGIIACVQGPRVGRECIVELTKLFVAHSTQFKSTGQNGKDRQDRLDRFQTLRPFPLLDKRERQAKTPRPIGRFTRQDFSEVDFGLRVLLSALTSQRPQFVGRQMIVLDCNGR